MCKVQCASGYLLRLRFLGQGRRHFQVPESRGWVLTTSQEAGGKEARRQEEKKFDEMNHGFPSHSPTIYAQVVLGCMYLTTHAVPNRYPLPNLLLLVAVRAD